MYLRLEFAIVVFLQVMTEGTVLWDNDLFIGKTRWSSCAMDEDDMVSRGP